MKRLSILVLMLLVSATAAVDAAQYQPPTKFSRKIEIPNNMKNRFTTNDDTIDSTVNRAARQRNARENRRNHRTDNTVTEDDRTQGEDKFSSSQRQGRRDRTNNRARNQTQSQLRQILKQQSVNGQSGLNE